MLRKINTSRPTPAQRPIDPQPDDTLGTRFRDVALLYHIATTPALESASSNIERLWGAGPRFLD